MKHPLRLLFFPLLLAGIFVLSCGYQLVGMTGKSKILLEDNLSMGKFKNSTSYSRAGIILEEKIRRELISNGFTGSFSPRGRYEIGGIVLNMEERPVGFSKERFGLEYELNSTVNLEVLRKDTGESVITLEGISDTTTYYSGSDPTYTRTNREKAVESVMERISERFVNMVKEK